ncbi:hypothetical protein FSARC_3603 [Fusarium sarcochroum]|uniref:F-box domain-containing protein n=1 Tax=Fusarium sarcochroum TaxID=1208366 RepID=A0A8H4XCG5_9HYPO|nr:hypothetical protein FSARC_3603 [Fusarium sarcochroum]
MSTKVPAAIERVPTHIIHIIGSMTSAKDVENLSRTCSKLRSKLGRLVWSHVLIHGNEHDLISKLNILGPGVAKNREKLGFVRKARILLTQERPLVSHGCGDYEYEADFPIFLGHQHGALPSAIIQTVGAMSTLKSLILILRGMADSQRNEFRFSLRLSPVLKLEHLRLDAEKDLTNTVLRQCLGTSLKALHLSRGVKSSSFKLAAGKFKGLEMLRLSLDGNMATEMPTRSMNAQAIKDIATAFPHLKCLILCEGPSNHPTGQRYTIRTPTQRQAFQRQVTKLADALREKMPELQRFACTLWRKRLGNNIAIEAVGPNDNQTLTDQDWEPFFTELMGRITDGHPLIQEVCILTELPRFYHWNSGTTRLVIRGNKRSADFPFGLEI